MGKRETGSARALVLMVLAATANRERIA